jgi:hypothetical protein
VVGLEGRLVFRIGSGLASLPDVGEDRDDTFPPPDVLISDSTAGPVGQPLHPFHRRDALPRGTLQGRCRTVGIMPKKDAARPSADASCDATQCVFDAVAAPTENLAPSPAEGTREDSEARWKAFYKNRWERRRKLLPNLKLKYPDDDEQECIAQLAGVVATLMTIWVLDIFTSKL